MNSELKVKLKSKAEVYSLIDTLVLTLNKSVRSGEDIKMTMGLDKIADRIYASRFSVDVDKTEEGYELTFSTSSLGIKAVDR